MKKATKIWMALLVFVAMLEAVVATVSATEGDTDLGSIALMIAFIIIGIVILVAGFKKVKGVSKLHPALAVAGCILMFVIAGFAGGYIPNPLAVTEEEDEVVASSFDITPTGSATGILNSAKTGFTVPAYANQSAHTIIQVDNSTAWADPVFTFAVEPVMEDIEDDADTMCKLIVEVTNPDLTIDTTTDDYYLITKSGGNRQWVWDIDGKEKFVKGNKQMLLTGNASITLTPDINQDSFSRMEDVYDAVTAYVKFSNLDGTWSQQFKIEFMLTHTWTG